MHHATSLVPSLRIQARRVSSGPFILSSLSIVTNRSRASTLLSRFSRGIFVCGSTTSSACLSERTRRGRIRYPVQPRQHCRDEIVAIAERSAHARAARSDFPLVVHNPQLRNYNPYESTIRHPIPIPFHPVSHTADAQGEKHPMIGHRLGFGRVA